MSDEPVEARLVISVEGTHLIAQLTFFNLWSEPVYLERAKTRPGHRLEYNLFHIYDGEDRIPFSGALAKRPPPTPDEFDTLVPGGTVEATVRLDRSYDFPHGAREYEIFYQAVNASRGEQPLFKLVSNRVTVEYRRGYWP